jgi:hypothetical protein
VKRIVITSSCAAVITVPQSKPTVYTEEDWNSSSVKVVEEMGNKSPPFIAYYASKTLAEKGGFLNIFSFGLALTCFLQSAAWDFYEQHKAQIKWDLVVILPGMVSFFFKNDRQLLIVK